jgi:hypothetical protein
MINCKHKEYQNTRVSPGGVMLIADFKCNNEKSGYVNTCDITANGKTISPCESCKEKE